MNLPNPITVNIPPLGQRTFTALPLTIIDSEQLKRVQVQMRPFMKALTIWEGQAYDVAGNYTQAQVEERVIELLGDDPAKVLEGLFFPPAPRS